MNYLRVKRKLQVSRLNKVCRLILYALFSFTLFSLEGHKSYASLAVSDQFHLGYQLVQDWDITSADKLSQQLLEEHPESGDAHLLRARVEFMKGNYERSWKLLRRVGDNFSQVKEFKTHVDATRRASQNFISKETKHFIFRFEEGPDEILIHRAEEVLEMSYQVLGKILNYYPEEKVLVEFYPDREPFSHISPLTLKDILTSGTVALCKYNRIMMISPGSLVRGFNWMDTLSHEYVHYLLTKKSRNHLPLWMQEGVAKFLESRWRQEEQYLSPIMETVLSKALNNDYRVPLEAMMPSFAKLKTAEDVQLAYAEVSSMMEYLTTIKGLDVLPNILESLSSGAEFENIFLQYAGQDLIEFQKNWEAWAKQLTYKSIPGIKSLPIEFKNRKGIERNKPRMLVSRKTRDFAFLADILKSRDHFKAAIIEYQKALHASSTHSPILFNKLAATYLQTQNYDEAELLLKKSLEYFPDFHTSLVNMGELYFSRQDYETGRVYFEKAVRINPFNPFVHMRLILVYDKLGLAREKELQAKQFSYID